MAEPPIERFELTLRMDATVTMYNAAGEATDWLKPGSEASATWSGMPSAKEVALRYEDLAQVARTTLQAVIIETHKRLREARQQG